MLDASPYDSAMRWEAGGVAVVDVAHALVIEARWS